MRLLPWLKAKARYLKLEAHALWLAFRHPRTPWYAKAVLVLVLLYLMSPVDLIPDVIPVLGMLDDLLVLGFGVWLARRLIPADVMADCRARAREAEADWTLAALWKKLKEW